MSPGLIHSRHPGVTSSQTRIPVKRAPPSGVFHKVGMVPRKSLRGEVIVLGDSC